MSNKSQAANGINGKVIAGFLWTVPNTAFVLSPEVYLGQGSAQITLQESAYDPDAGGSTKGLQSTLKQNITMGFILRTGFYLADRQNNLLYVLFGVDQSKFENKFTLSSTDLAGPVPTLFEKRSKMLKGPVIGFGFEKKLNKLKIGIDLRYTRYSEWGKYSQEVPVSGDRFSVKIRPTIITTTLTFCYLF